MTRLALITDIPDLKEIEKRIELLRTASYKPKHFSTPDDYLEANDPHDLIVLALGNKNPDLVFWDNLEYLLKHTAKTLEPVFSYTHCIYSSMPEKVERLFRVRERKCAHICIERWGFGKRPEPEWFAKHIMPRITKIFPPRPGKGPLLNSKLSECGVGG